MYLPSLWFCRCMEFILQTFQPQTQTLCFASHLEADTLWIRKTLIYTCLSLPLPPFWPWCFLSDPVGCGMPPLRGNYKWYTLLSRQLPPCLSSYQFWLKQIPVTFQNNWHSELGGSVTVMTCLETALGLLIEFTERMHAWKGTMDKWHVFTLPATAFCCVCWILSCFATLNCCGTWRVKSQESCVA